MPHSSLESASSESVARKWVVAVANGKGLSETQHLQATSGSSGICLPLHTVRPPSAPPSPPSPPSPPCPALPPQLPPSSPPAVAPNRPPLPPPALPPPTISQACKLVPNACLLEVDEWYCTTVQAVNAHGIATARVRSNGVRMCNAPLAGMVVEVFPRPTPPQSIYFGVHALVPYAQDTGDDEAGLTQDSDYVRRDHLRFRWHSFRDDCAMGIELFNLTLLHRVEVERFDSPVNNTSSTNNTNNTNGIVSLEWLEVNSTIFRRSTRAHESSFPLEAPGMYRVRVCGTAVSGLTSCAMSDGTVYDITPPVAGRLCIQVSPRKWCVSEQSADSPVATLGPSDLARARAFWVDFGDADSKVAGFMWAVGAESGASDVHVWKNVGWQTHVPLASINVSAVLGSTFYVTVLCLNSVGLSVNLSIPVLFDLTVPILSSAALQVHPGLPLGLPAPSMLYASSTTPQLAVNVAHALDFESTIVEAIVTVYELEASLRARKPDVLFTTSLSRLNETVLLSPGTLQKGRSYNVVLLVRNGADLQASLKMPLEVDEQEPTNGRMFVCDASGQEIYAQADNSTLRLCTSEFSALSSGTLYHLIKLKLADGTDLGDYAIVHGLSMVVNNLDLPCGRQIHIVTTAHSGAMVASAVSLNSQVSIDCTPPQAQGIGFTTISHRLRALTTRATCSDGSRALFGWWNAFIEPDSNISSYAIALSPVQSEAPAQDAAGWQVVGLRQFVLLEDLTPTTLASAYSLHVRACNNAGRCAVQPSEYPLLYAQDSPSNGVVSVVTPFDRAFIGLQSQIGATWAGFTDPTVISSSDIDGSEAWQVALQYEACVGTSPYSCRLQGFMSVGSNESWNADGLSLVCGVQHYVTVRVTNCAGLQSTAVSEPVQLCCTPPIASVVTIRDASSNRVDMLLGNGLTSYTVTWSEFSDTCAGMHGYTVSLLSANGDRLWNVTTSGLAAAIPRSALATLIEGEQYRFEVVGNSYSGLSASADASVRVDTTSPTIGDVSVRFGPYESEWLSLNEPGARCWPEDAGWLELRWHAEDTESGILSWEYAWVGAIEPKDYHWSSMESPTLTRFSLQYLQRVIGDKTSDLVFIAVRNCNTVGLCNETVVSTAINMDSRPPSAGVVRLVPPNNASQGYFVPGQLLAQVAGFVEAGCPSVCGQNGTTALNCYYDETCDDNPPRLGGFGCNAGYIGQRCRFCGFGSYERCPLTAMNLTHGGNMTSYSSSLTYEACVGTTPFGCQLQAFVSIGTSLNWQASNLPLVCGANHFITVRATNCAGLQHTTASDAAKLCCDPPSEGVVTIQDDTGAELSFVGNGLMARVRVQWSGFHDICSGVREYEVLMVSADEVQWRSAKLPSTSGSIHLPLGELESLADGERLDIVVIATNRAGLASNATTTFTIDRSAPLPTSVHLRWPGMKVASEYDYRIVQATSDVTCIASGVETIEINWNQWSDPTSAIAFYAISVLPSNTVAEGTPSNRSFDDVGLRPMVSIAFADVMEGASSLSIAVRGCDAVGLCSLSPIHYVYLIGTAPHLDGNITMTAQGGALTDRFLNPHMAQSLGATWIGMNSGGWGPHAAEVPLVSVYHEVCVGTTPFGCQLQAFVSIGTSLNWQASNLPLVCGANHFITVRATNCAGLQHTTASDAAKLCCDPPSEGVVTIQDDTGAELSFVGNGLMARVRVQWSGFHDICSGVREYEVLMVSADEVQWRSAKLPSTSGSIHLPLGELESLADGERLDIVVIATNRAGLASNATTTFMIDRTPPQIGNLYNAEQRTTACQAISEPIQISWEQIEDPESGIRSIDWGVGLAPYSSDLMPWRRVDGDDGSVARTWDASANLAPGSVIYSTLRVSNGAGDVISFLASPVRLVASTCSASYMCLPPATNGVLPWMLPLVLSQLYAVNGELNTPKFMKATARMELRVQIARLPSENDGSTWTRMLVAHDSRLYDRFGSPISHAFDHEMLRFPLLYRQGANGSLSELAHHPQDSEGSISLKKMLVGLQQIPNFDGMGTIASTPGIGEAMTMVDVQEHDTFGNATATYAIRRGLPGRTVVSKDAQYMSSEGRPAVITQTSTSKAILDRRGRILRMHSKFNLDMDVNSLLPRDGRNHTEMTGLELLPKEPIIATWTILPDESLENAPHKRQLGSVVTQELAHFVRIPPFVDTLLSDDSEKASCTADAQHIKSLIRCVTFDRAALVNGCLYELVEVSASCPLLEVEYTLASTLIQDDGPIDGTQQAIRSNLVRL